MPESWRSQYPFASHFLTRGSHHYHYLDEGDPAAPPLLMLHGNPTWSFYYRHLIPGLSKTHRVIVPDHIGCGLSDKPQNYAYTLENHIRNLEALIEHLGLQKPSIVMHDWGGIIGMGYATRHPENISRLIVLNTGAFHVKPRAIPLSIHFCRLPVIGQLAVQGLNAFAGLATFFAVTRRDRMTKTVRSGYLAPYNSWQNRIAVHRFIRDIPFSPSHVSYPVLDRIDTGLERLKDHPMLIVWGGKDFVFNVKNFLSVWKQRFPQADVCLLEDAGHYVVEDAHERMLPRMLEFLQRSA